MVDQGGEIEMKWMRVRAAKFFTNITRRKFCHLGFEYMT